MPSSLEEKQNLFFSSPYYAVVGASTDQTRWATKVLKWYVERDMAITPIHPIYKELEGLETTKSIDVLSHPKETSISLITVPQFTLRLLGQCIELGVPAIWIQPGAADEAVIAFIEDPANGLSDRVIYGGPCVLVQGDEARTRVKAM